MLEPRTEFTDLMIKNKKLEAEIERLRSLLKACRRILPQHEFRLIDEIDDAIGVNEQP